MGSMPLALRTVQLVKRYGTTTALDGFDIDVEQGTVVGLLGPNGAGKTTAVRILATLLRADSGHAEVAGFDVATQPQQVRSVIGLTGQYAAIDENLTGRENLEMIGRLTQLGRPEARARAGELLERFELAHAADRPGKTYSGGMRRRLDLAASLVGRPAVLFLDEPTTGLDPRSRNALWEIIRDLVSEGTTLLLTTQYLDEADVLADNIAVIDGGKVIARGTATELKDRIGGEVLALRPADPSRLDDVAGALESLGSVVHDLRVDREAGTVTLPLDEDRTVLTAAPRRLDEEGIVLADIGVRRPSLDDVFMTLTGHRAEGDLTGDDEGGEEGNGRRRGRRAARAREEVG
jgi:ABC-2 type transport system ATP-binding protein